MTKPITILIAALGGEGGGVLAEWLVAVADDAGYPVQSTSIPGVAQRTGATTYYVEVWPEPVASLGGRSPVLSLLPVPGCIDLLVASELLEAVRSAQSGMVSPDRTCLVTSVSRTLTTAEKMPLGDGRFDSERLLEVARCYSRRFAPLDMDKIARAAGTVVSAVMFGAIAASGLLPFTREQFEAVIRASGRGAEASLAGFARGWDAVQHTEAAPDATVIAGRVETTTTPARQLPDANSATLIEAFPELARDVVTRGYDRVLEFQDGRYADLYLRRVAVVLDLERCSDPHEAHGYRADAGDRALSRAVDGIRRYRSRRRSQVARRPIRARPA